MSIGSIMNAGLSGLNATQTALRTTSNNIANVNSPGYVRQVSDLQARTGVGGGVGVEVASLRRAADRFLQAASLRSLGLEAGEGARARILDQAQASLGDPGVGGGVFGAVENVQSRLAELAIDPGSSIRRSAFLSEVTSALNEFARVDGEIENLAHSTDAEIGAAVERIDALLGSIHQLNKDIARASTADGAAAGLQDQQSRHLDELAGLIGIRTTARADGGVDVRTADGVLLVGYEVGRVSYRTGADPYDQIQVTIGGQAVPLDAHLGDSQLGGLVKARDTDLPHLRQALAELAAGLADQLNRGHSDNTAVPAPTRLDGRNTGLVLADAHGFVGQSTLAIVDANGNLSRRVDINFSAGTISVDGGAPTGFAGTVQGLRDGLNTALGGLATVSFTNGTLSIQGSNAARIVNQDVSSDRGGRSFAHFFGLNDLVRSGTPIFHETGFTAAQAHNLNAGGALTFRVRDASGQIVSTTSVPINPGSFQQILNDLNSAASGLGLYAQFGIDGAGRLTQIAQPGAENHQIELVQDTSVRGASGASFSALFGLGENARLGRSAALSLDGRIASDAQALALARPDLSAGILPPARILEAGDGRGADALITEFGARRSFSASGLLSGQTANVVEFAAKLAGAAGSSAQAAADARDMASAVSVEAAARRASVEGVNLDEELARMTVLQQHYAASSRLIQAAKDLYDTLLTIL